MGSAGAGETNKGMASSSRAILQSWTTSRLLASPARNVTRDSQQVGRGRFARRDRLFSLGMARQAVPASSANSEACEIRSGSVLRSAAHAVGFARRCRMPIWHSCDCVASCRGGRSRAQCPTTYCRWRVQPSGTRILFWRDPVMAWAGPRLTIYQGMWGRRASATKSLHPTSQH